MQRKQAVTIKLSDNIKSIFEIYERQRPGDLAASYAVLTPQVNNEEGLFAKIGKNAADAAVTAEMGALGGQTGVLVAAGYQGIKTLVGHVWQWTSVQKNETAQVFNLAYLEPTLLSQNLNISENGNQRIHRLEVLNKLYHYTYKYQQLKGKRFGFSLFGLSFGEHREDSTIDDCKYLVNILIGRKLRLAAEAKDEDTYNKQLEHLYQFLEEIVNNSAILASKSDDSTYSSLRNVINVVKKDLLQLESIEAESSANKDLMTALQENISAATKSANTLKNEIRNRVTYIISNLIPNEFSLNHEDKLQSPAITNPLAKDYPQLIKKLFYHFNSPSDQDLNELTDGICRHIGISRFSNEPAMNAVLKNIIENNNHIQRLSDALSTFNEIKEKAGVLALIDLSDELSFLLQELKNAQFAAIKTHKAFIDLLSKEFNKSKYQDFKNNFTQYGYKRLLSDINFANNAIISLEQISLNKETEKKNLQDEIVVLINKFKVNLVNIFGYKPSEATPEDHIEIEINEEDNDEILKDWVEVNIKEEGESFAENLPKEIKETSWYHNIFNAGMAEHKLAALQQEIDSLSNRTSSLEANERKYQDEIHELKTKNTDQEKTINRIENTKKLQQAIEQYRNVFDEFIRDYIRRNHASRGLFHFHGSHGRDVAVKIQMEFNDIICLLKNDGGLTLDTLQKITYNRFRKMLSDNIQLLDGNHHSHSLKTYLLAYANYLNDDNSHAIHNPVATYHEDQYVKDKSKNVKKLYEDLLDIAEPSIIPIDVTSYYRQ